MGKKKIDSWLLDDWLEKSHLTEGSSDSYRQYLSSIEKIVEEPYKDFILLIQWFLENRENIYALSVLDRVCEYFRQNRNKLTTPNKNHSALVSFEKYVKELCNSSLPKKDPSQTEKLTPEIIRKVKHSFKKSELHKLDGMDALMHTLGEEQFIKYAVENSYFFNPDMVIDRFQKITHAKELPIRKGDYPHKQTDIFDDGKYIIPISFDKDNNTEVRKVINEHTGYTVSSGKDCIFQNYKVSHIWGRASDPRYFTALWNLVIIPAWANDLMDKENAEKESLASKLRATYMKICWKQYKMDKLNWDDIKMKLPAVVNPEDAQKGGFWISQFEVRNGKELSAISRQKITIKYI